MADNRLKACDTCGYYYRECACGGRDPHGYRQGYAAGKRDVEMDLDEAYKKKREAGQVKLAKTGKKAWRIA